MRIIRFCLSIISIILTIPLWGDIMTPTTNVGSPVQVSGFKQIPQTVFYALTIHGFPSNTTVQCHPITDDAAPFTGNASLYYREYISWDQKLATLEPDKAYPVKGLGIDLEFRNKESVHPGFGIPITRFPGFKSISSEYKITKDKRDKADSISGYQLTLSKRTYTHQNFTITETGDFEKIPRFIQAKVPEANDYNNFDPISYTALVKYASGLPHHKVLAGSAYYKQKVIPPLPSIITPPKDPPPKPIQDNPGKADGKMQPVHSLVNQAVSSVYFLQSGYNLKLFLLALLFSIFLEYLILIALYKPVTGRRGLKAGDYLKLFAVCALGTAFTITIIWGGAALFQLPALAYVVVCELFAVLIEGCLYAWLLQMRFRQAMFISIVCNLVSYGLGLLLFPYIQFLGGLLAANAQP